MSKNYKTKINSLFLIFTLLFAALTACKKDDSVLPPVTNEPPSNGIKLVEPPDNYNVNNYTPLLKWESYSGAESYNLLLSMDANFLGTIIDTNSSSTEVTVPSGILNTNIYYYWKVKANLGGGNFTDWSAIRKFKVILAPPPAPILILPANNSVNQPFLPLFDWEDSPTAQVYRLQLSLNSAFTQVILDTGLIPISQLQAPYFYINTGTNYYWRVNATNSNGASTGDWSNAFTFRTIDGNMPSSISGRVTFTDNNFIPSPEKYFISAYRTANWPPANFSPVNSDTLEIQFINNQYIADFRLERVPDGNYHLTVNHIGNTIGNELVHKSVYGCDTSRVIYSNCPENSPGTVSILNGNGVVNINMLSWADSAKSIF